MQHHPEMTIMLARERCADRAEAAMIAAGRGERRSRVRPSLRAVVGRGLVRIGTRLIPANAEGPVRPRALSVSP